MIATDIKSDSLRQHYGEIVRANATLTVRIENDVLLTARRASSCLLEPIAGDTVMVLTDSSRAKVYVLAVLERADNTASTLALPADTEIRAADGRLRMTARDGIGFETPADMTILATTFNASADKGDVLINNLSFTGDVLHGCIERIKLVGRSLDALLERYHLRARRSYRRIDEIDQVQASQIHHEAKHTLSMHAKNTLMTADELVKFDAEQIHMG